MSYELRATSFELGALPDVLARSSRLVREDYGNG